MESKPRKATRSSTGEDEIAQAYLAAADNDAHLALRCAISDALADLSEAEHKTLARNRLISHGFVRGRV